MALLEKIQLKLYDAASGMVVDLDDVAPYDSLFDAPCEILEVKDNAEEKGIVEAYASVFGNVDSYGDIVTPGAFAETIGEKRKGTPVRVLYQHKPDTVIGVPLLMKEDSKGLFTRTQYIVGQNVPKADEAYALMRNKAIDTMSFGFNTLDYEIDGKAQTRKLTRLHLWEYSPVTFPANPKARVTGVKAAVPFGNLPLAARDKPWTAAAADKRVRAWAGATDAPNAKYRKAFFWCDESAADNFGAYKLPFADVIDGELTAIPRGIFGCAAALMGSRGGVQIPDADRGAVKSVIGKYYTKMAKEFDDDTLVAPWAKSDSFGDLLRASADLITDVRQYEGFLCEAGFSATEAKKLAAAFKTVRPQCEAAGGFDEVLAALRQASETLSR